MDNKAIRLANLRLLMKGAKKADLARRTGLNQSYFSQIEKRDGAALRNIGDDAARRLETGMGKPPGWMDLPHSSANESGQDEDHVPIRKVRLISWTQAAGGLKGMSLDSGGENAAVVYAAASAGDGAFALRVRGDSMVNIAGGPSFPAESIIVVDPTIEAMPGYPVVVKLKDALEAVFKIYEFDGKDYFLKPLNPRYPIAPMPADASIIGVVISVQSETLPHLKR